MQDIIIGNAIGGDGEVFEFDEFEFLRETQATIKFGIRHKDWRRVGHSYDGPIDDPIQVSQSGAMRRVVLKTGIMFEARNQNQ